jgi:FHS family L-fucose permease-like MFS transporter
VTILGPEPTASSRLNLSQAFNSLGTTIGPLLGGWLIFHVFTRPGMQGAASVKIPYLCFAAVFAALAVLFKFAHLPAFTNAEHIDRTASVWKHWHAVAGIGAIFMYVGGEVTVGSSLINFLGTERLGGLSHEAASSFLAFYWGGLMVGRFMGAFALSEMSAAVKRLLLILVPAAAFVVVLLTSGRATAGHYGIFLVLLVVAFFAGSASPQRMLAVFGTVIIALLGVGTLASGGVAMWSVVAVGLFCSVMWSNIFSLAIDGLGALKSKASSLLVMAILGGAVLPPLQGAVADRWSLQWSFVVPMVAFAYVTAYGLFWKRLRAPQQ